MTINPTEGRFAGLAGDLDGDDDQRPPLVLLHGLTFDRTMWGPTLAELRTIDPGRRVLALDLPGHGDTPDDVGYGFAAGVDRLHAAIESAGLRAPVLVGHSLGAMAVTGYAASHPTRGIVNVDQTLQTEPFAVFLHSIAEQLRGPGFPQIFEKFVDSMHPELLPADAETLVRATCRPRQEVVLGYWADVLNRPPDATTGDVTNMLQAVRTANIPYLIVAGDDPEPGYRAWLANTLPHATLTAWPGSGHFPHLAHPDAFARVLASTAAWPEQTSADGANRPATTRSEPKEHAR